MDELVIAGRKFKSRLLIGTGKFSSNQAMLEAMEASGSDIVTVALRRVDIDNPEDYMLKHIDRQRYLLLPNTSGARDCEEAVRLARLSRAAGCEPWIKLEVTPDPYYLLPDPIETFKAAQILVKDGFTVLPYINADPILAKHLQEIGCATVMPLGPPSAPTRECGCGTTSPSSSSRPTFPWSSTPGWALLPTRPRPWRWAPTRCWSTRRWPFPPTRG